MNLFNYDYKDLIDTDFSFLSKEEIEQLPETFQSRIYPVELSIYHEESTNTPYLRYVGIAKTNKGYIKITFPKLDLVISYMTQTKKDKLFPMFENSLQNTYTLDFNVCSTTYKEDENCYFFIDPLTDIELKDLAEKLQLPVILKTLNHSKEEL